MTPKEKLRPVSHALMCGGVEDTDGAESPEGGEHPDLFTLRVGNGIRKKVDEIRSLVLF